jgi:stage V sporulation protein G
MTSLDVEVVDVRKITGDGNLKAFADVKIGGNLIIKGFSVMQGKRGIFVSMPKKAGKDGRWFDILTPLDEGLKQELQDKVLEAYDKEADGVTD